MIALGLVIAAPASAAPQMTSIGQAGPFIPAAEFANYSPISVPNPVVQARTGPTESYTYVVPFDGVITEFRYRSYSNLSPSVQLVVADLREAWPSFYVRAYSPVMLAGPYGTLRPYATRVPVRAGDVIGMHSSDVDAWFWGVGDDQARQLDTAAAPGQSTIASSSYSQSAANVVATVQSDEDGDGHGDVTGDNCVGTFNDPQTDTDNDSQGDGCDPDDDNDGAADGADTFPLNAAETRDTDSDGTGDNADADDDNDGAADGADAFPRDASETSDADGDGRPDAVDEDDDNDGLADVLENRRGTSPVDVDSDDDGLPDPDERRTNPAVADSDRDGLPDGRELGITQPVPDPLGAVLGTAPELFAPDAHPRSKTDPLKRDTDRDGLADGREDRNRNGKRERSETDPLARDTDRDGIVDGRDRKPLKRVR